MTIEHLLAFNIALLAAFMSPGPALLMAMRTALASGWRSAVVLGCGLALMASLWTVMALAGLEIVFQMFPWAYGVLRVGGALYLAFIAYQTWTHARASIELPETPHGRLFWQGFTVNLLNPKCVLFSAAVLVVIFPTGMTLWQNAVVVLNQFVLEVVLYTGVALVMSRAPIRARYLAVKVWFDRTASVVLGGLSVRLLAER